MKNRKYCIFQRFFFFVLSLVLMFASELSAQQKSERYPIGSLTYPVTAKEYCFFLNQDPSALRAPHYNSYYDHQLMNSGPNQVIACTGMPGDYYYSSVQGSEDVVIPDLESQGAQKDFMQWRKHLSLGDVCNYLNAQIIIKWDAAHLKNLSLEDLQELGQAHLTVDLIHSHYQGLHICYDMDYDDEFSKMQHVVDLLLQNEPQAYTILEGKQGWVYKSNWDWFLGIGKRQIIHSSNAFLISFPSSTEKPVVSLVPTKNEYERLDVRSTMDGTHLQFPKSLGGAVIPGFDFPDYGDLR